MKKNRLMRIAALLLVLTLATSCFVGGTFAKYTSTTEATDTARVALWKFTIDENGDENVASTETFTFDLFNTVKEIGEDADDAEVKNTSDEFAIIAPGTTGSFDVVLTNKSEVTAEYKYAFAVDAAGVPLEFSTNGTDGWTGDIATLDKDTFTTINMDGTVTITLYWRWAFERGAGAAEIETNNDADTTLGLAGSAKPKVTVTIDVQQVN